MPLEVSPTISSENSPGTLSDISPGISLKSIGHYLKNSSGIFRKFSKTWFPNCFGDSFRNSIMDSSKMLHRFLKKVLYEMSPGIVSNILGISSEILLEKFFKFPTWIFQSIHKKKLSYIFLYIINKILIIIIFFSSSIIEFSSRISSEIYRVIQN